MGCFVPIPRQQLVDPALLMAVDDGRQRGRQIGKRINGIELACLDERSDGRPVLSSHVMSGKECVLAVEGYRPDGSLDGVVVDLDTTVGQKELQTIPVFGNMAKASPSGDLPATRAR